MIPINHYLNKFGLELKRKPAEGSITQTNIQFNATKDSLLQTFDHFEDHDGNVLPVYERYRYSMKPGWLAVASLKNLYFLSNLGKLSEAEEKVYKSFIGTHTITTSISEIDAFASSICKKHSNLFQIIETSTKVEFEPIQTREEFSKIISNLTANISYNLKKKIHYKQTDKLRVLDVGCGRGLSSAAYAKLGHNVVGIDNDYGGGDAYAMAKTREQVNVLVEEPVEFINGDITNCPEIAEDSFDLIVSGSCLEHILDIDAALSEMHRVLRPGGVMLHSLNPFWAENGAHALGILDAPWLHAMLSVDDYEKYLRAFRPNEIDLALPWAKTALNRNITINSLQRSLISAGFNITSWQEMIGKQASLGRISPFVLKHVQKMYSDVTLCDLLARDILFTATK